VTAEGGDGLSELAGPHPGHRGVDPKQPGAQPPAVGGEQDRGEHPRQAVGGHRGHPDDRVLDRDPAGADALGVRHAVDNLGVFEVGDTGRGEGRRHHPGPQPTLDPPAEGLGE